MIKLTAYFALAMAIALLGLQIIGGLEYTVGGSFYTRASMTAAMVVLACLPVFVKSAEIIGASKINSVLVVATLAFLAYSLPATTGRTGEVKEAKVAGAADVLSIKADIAAVQQSIDYATPTMLAECDGAPEVLPPNRWPECRRTRASVTAFAGQLERLQDDLAAAGGPSATVGDMGSELWAWALTPFGVTADVVRKISIISFALGLDIIIWALVALAVELLMYVPRASNDNSKVVPPNAADALPDLTVIPKPTNVIRVWAREFEGQNQRHPTLPELHLAFPGVPRSTLHRKAFQDAA
jgi:hypothetical protein